MSVRRGFSRYNGPDSMTLIKSNDHRSWKLVSSTKALVMVFGQVIFKSVQERPGAGWPGPLMLVFVL